MIQVWGLTDSGLVRKDNQDAYATAHHAESGYTIAVVCDGMGGVKGGRLASSIAVEIFLDHMERALRSGMTEGELAELSARAVAAANEAIYEKSQQMREYRGMGTTLVAAICCESGAVISNVGDSRAYHISGEGIRRITHDHSLVQTLLMRGDITEEEARVHPNRNVITRALGPERTETCDSFTCPLHAGESLLLCSDGLVNTVSDQEILYEILHGEESESCLERLLAISKSRGAADNVTAVLLKID